MQMQSKTLPASGTGQEERAIAGAAWGGLDAAERVSLWAGIHARDMLGSTQLEMRLLADQPFLAPWPYNRLMHCTYRPGGFFPKVRSVPLPAELCGLWFTLTGLSIDSVQFNNPAAGAAQARLEACAKKLVADLYPEHVRAFTELCDGSVLAQSKPAG